MKTVQMTLDEELLKEVDQVTRCLHTSRSAFTRHALHEELARYHTRQLEAQHRQGYEKNPPATDEFSVWDEEEQAWGEE